MVQYMLGTTQAEANQPKTVKIRLAEPNTQKLTWAIGHLRTLESWFREWEVVQMRRR